MKSSEIFLSQRETATKKKQEKSGGANEQHPVLASLIY
jgi:hypothetical protein